MLQPPFRVALMADQRVNLTLSAHHPVLLITFSPDNIIASVIPLPLNAVSRYF